MQSTSSDRIGTHWWIQRVASFFKLNKHAKSSREERAAPCNCITLTGGLLSRVRGVSGTFFRPSFFMLHALLSLSATFVCLGGLS